MTDLKKMIEKVDFYVILKALEYSAAFLQNKTILSKLANIVTKRRRTIFTTLSKSKVSNRLSNIEEVSYRLLSFLQIFEYKDQFEDLSSQLGKILNNGEKNEKNHLIISEEIRGSEVEELIRSSKRKRRNLLQCLKLLIIINEIAGNIADTTSLISSLILKFIYIKNKRLVRILEYLLSKSEKFTDIFWSFSLICLIMHSVIILMIKRRALQFLYKTQANLSNSPHRDRLTLEQEISTIKWDLVQHSLDLITSSTSAINDNDDDEKYEWTLLFSIFSAASSIIELFC